MVDIEVATDRKRGEVCNQEGHGQRPLMSLSWERNGTWTVVLGMFNITGGPTRASADVS